MPADDEDPNNLYGDDDDVDVDVDDESVDDDDVDEEDDVEEHDEPDEKPNKRKISEPEAEDVDINTPSSPSSSSSSQHNPKNPNPTPSSSAPPAPPLPSAPSTSGGGLSSPDQKRQKVATISTTVEDSRRLFQRLWTDEDEILLLEGFLEYTGQRHGGGRGRPNHDTVPFYDQIKTRLQLDCNKNQLVEKIRRLKKKYRNTISRIGSGKDFSFKTPHEQAAFEISRKIWSNNPSTTTDNDEDGSGNKIPRSQRRNRKRSDEAAAAATPAPAPAPAPARAPPAAEENVPNLNFPHVETPVAPTPVATSIPNVIEETVKSCLSPLFKELLYYAINGPCNSAVGGVALNPLPLNFGGNLAGSEAMDERWRKQQILELEVYSKRLELVQEQINSALEELRSMGG